MLMLAPSLLGSMAAWRRWWRPTRRRVLLPLYLFFSLVR